MRVEEGEEGGAEVEWHAGGLAWIIRESSWESSRAYFHITPGRRKEGLVLS